MSSSYPHLKTSDRHGIPLLRGLQPTIVEWPGEPTPIVPPSNDYRYTQDRAPTSTRTKNPHNWVPRRDHRIGNPTSRSTIVQKGSSTSGPSPKRRKLEKHLPPANSKGMNKDSPYFVHDDDIGPDELNLRSNTPDMRPSKFVFSSDLGSSKVYTIIDDGETTKQIASSYSSDPIGQFSPGPREERRTFVSKMVHQFEKDIAEIPKLDLIEESHKLKESNKRRMKGKSKGNSILKPASMTWTKPEQQPDRVPVHSFYADSELCKSAPHQQLWIYTRNRRLLIEENSKKLIDEPVDVYTMLLAKPNEVEISSAPTIQFMPANRSKTITILLDTKHPQWNKELYNGFVEILIKHFAVKNRIMRSEQTARLWEMAVQNAKVQDNELHKPKLSATGLKDDLQSKPGKMNDSPLSMHATTKKTSLKRKAGIDPLSNQAESPSHLFKIGSSSRPKPNAIPTERNLRSRQKVAFDAEPVPSALANPDEVVLSYPAGLPGAVNITNVDLERLNPGAFLNDTLIEFGLKVWLRDLEISNPELVDQIHVFSSFFYKKFNTTKDLQLAYESVRKWTNKFDIFRKRYIIVPINEHLHWYLAIIYEPEHVLKDPPLVNLKSPPRPQTRLSTAQAILEIDSNSSRIDQPLDPLEIQMEDIDQRSEIEVERDLEIFQNSCTIEDCVSQSHGIDEPLSRSEDDVMASPNRPMISEDDSTANQHSPAPKVRRSLGAVESKRFYHSPSTQRQYGKKKVGNGTKSPGMAVDPNERDEVEIIDNIPKTHIFTFDSLGSRHPQAVKRLSAYLRMEAKNKKGVTAGGLIEGKNALVPFQTNLCDCGIYLLHFAQTFMRDPRQYANIILAPRLKSIGDAERKAIWHVDNDFEPEGRRRIRLRIEDLSKDWKKLRGGAQKQPGEVTQAGDESEGEVELVESDTDREHSKLSRKTTGPASRVRG